MRHQRFYQMAKQVIYPTKIKILLLPVLNQLEETSRSIDMATAQHVKSLIQSHFQNEPERFRTLALQLAANEAKRGHVIFAEEIRKIIDQSRNVFKTPKALNHDLQGLVLESETKERLTDLIVSDGLKERLQRILKEYRKKDLLKDRVSVYS